MQVFHNSCNINITDDALTERGRDREREIECAECTYHNQNAIKLGKFEMKILALFHTLACTTYAVAAAAAHNDILFGCLESRLFTSGRKVAGLCLNNG